MKRRTLFGSILAACSFGLLPRASARARERVADLVPIWDGQRWVVLTEYGAEGEKWIEATPVPVPGVIVPIMTKEQDEIDDVRRERESARYWRAKAAYWRAKATHV